MAEAKKVDKSVDKVREDSIKAAATKAMETAIIQEAAKASTAADKSYIIEKKRHMLSKCKSDKKVDFYGDKLYAPYLGKSYTFLYNTIPVTVRFDGTTQKFPEFIVKKIQQILRETTEANTYKEVNVNYYDNIQ